MSATASLVATSLNPRDRLPHQLACLRRWQALGLAVRSFNNRAECERLAAAGVDPEVLVELADDDTMQRFGGRANPRILPVLQRLLASGAERVMLVNSDIYPAVTHDPLPLMTAQSAAACYTRADCTSIAERADAPRQSYFGGLDIFCFRLAGLEQIVEKALAHPETERMAFGVPGWDLYIGHEALAIGGRILEARFLLHPRHAAGYVSIESFEPLARVMIASGRYKSADHTALAAEFVARIQALCARDAADARLLQHALSDPAPAAPVPGEAAAPADATLADGAQLARPDWRTLHLAHRQQQWKLTPLGSYLAALQAAVALMRRSGRGQWSTRFPEGSVHAVQLEACLAEADPLARRDRLLDLLAADLYEHGVLNLNLLKYLRVQCEHEQEIRQFAALLQALRENFDEAIALAA